MCVACSPLVSILVKQASRRSFVRGLGASTFAASLGTFNKFLCEEAYAEAEGMDQLYQGGVILTMNDAQPVAEAVLVRDGLILGVGAPEKLRKFARGEPKISDLGGRTMLPAFSIRTDTSSWSDFRRCPRTFCHRRMAKALTSRPSNV